MASQPAPAEAWVPTTCPTGAIHFRTWCISQASAVQSICGLPFDIAGAGVSPARNGLFVSCLAGDPRRLFPRCWVVQPSWPVCLISFFTVALASWRCSWRCRCRASSAASDGQHRHHALAWKRRRGPSVRDRGVDALAPVSSASTGPAKWAVGQVWSYLLTGVAAVGAMAWHGTLGAQLAVEFGVQWTGQPACWRPVADLNEGPCQTSTPSPPQPGQPSLAGSSGSGLLVFGFSFLDAASSPSAGCRWQGLPAPHPEWMACQLRDSRCTSSSPGWCR